MTINYCGENLMPGKEAQEALQLIERGDFRCREYVMDMEQKNIYEEFLAEVADDKKGAAAPPRKVPRLVAVLREEEQLERSKLSRDSRP